MGTELLLGVRLNFQALTTIKLNNVNLKAKVEDLKNEAAGKVNLSRYSFELVYCGCILEDELTLESYGLKSGAMVHVLKKNSETTAPKESASRYYILKLVAVFKTFKTDPKFQSALHRVIRTPEVIDNIISCCPGLHQDTVAIAVLQDPDLMAHFTHEDTVRRITEAHPVLAEAAKSIVDAVYKEVYNNASGSSNSAAPTQPTPYSYSLDNLSDDEEMAAESSQSSDSIQPPTLCPNLSNSAITTAQVAAALSRARGRGLPLSNSASTTSSSTANSGVITTEMFTQAMQQVFATPTPVIPPNFPIFPPELPQLTDLRSQLAQMHEIGLQDDTVNLQALQFTNGDVMAAIELVFNGFSDN